MNKSSEIAAGTGERQRNKLLLTARHIMPHHTTDVLHYKQSIKAINKRNKRLESQFNGPANGRFTALALFHRRQYNERAIHGAIQSSFVMWPGVGHFQWPVAVSSAVAGMSHFVTFFGEIK